MKTIKELEAELNLNKNFDLNNWKGDKTFDVGYREALKDVLGLIDEFENEVDLLQLNCANLDNCKKVDVIQLTEELKARING